MATAFPSGQAPLAVKLADVRAAVEAGADEVDMVIDRGAFLSGHYGQVVDEVAAVKDACGQAHLKVILETGELGTYDAVRRASLLAIAGGADFIKTSTGKVAVNATPEAAAIMLREIQARGGRCGFKAAGGIRTLDEAAVYLDLADHILGPAWAAPQRFRIGASKLLAEIQSLLDAGPASRPG